MFFGPDDSKEYKLSYKFLQNQFFLTLHYILPQYQFCVDKAFEFLPPIVTDPKMTDSECIYHQPV